MPGFRVRTEHAKEGRLRPPLVVDPDLAEYESSQQDRHVDYALRFSQTYGDLDLGLSWFKGTSRDPVFVSGVDDDGEAVLIPFYEQMTQYGIDAQLIVEDWLWKLEAIRREAESNDFNAYTAGFEYSFYGVYGSVVDLGAIVEYSYDGRPKDEAALLDDDVFVASRIVFNDVQSSEIVAGFFVDLGDRSRSFRVEGSRRFGDSWKGTLELQTFSNVDPDSQLQAFAQDNFVRAELAYYY